MSIGLGQLTYLYDQLKRKKPDSELLNENFWSLRRKLDDTMRKQILNLLFNDQVTDAEQLLKNLI